MDEEEETNSKEPRYNSPGVGGVVITALLHMGKLSMDQQKDLAIASLDIVKFMVVEDMIQSIGEGGVETSEQVVHRLSIIAKQLEEDRWKCISRFSTLCELLKPEVDIEIEIEQP